MIMSESVPYSTFISESGNADGLIIRESGLAYYHDVISETFYEMRPELNGKYMQKAGMSLDGLFRPYVTMPYPNTIEAIYGSKPSGIPEMNVQQTLTGVTGVVSLSPFGPSGSGHDIAYVIRGGEIPPDLDCQKGGYDIFNFYRGIGFKFPMVGVGWGYDTDGYPVPAAASGTVLNPSGDSHVFAEDYLSNPANWKAGPVDLRWNQNRGMWVAPNSETAPTTTPGLIPAVALEAIQPYGSGHILALASTAASGNMALSFLGQPICSGQRMFVTESSFNANAGQVDVNISASINYLIVISEYSNLTIPTNIRCSSGNLVYDSANIYFPSAYSLTATSG